ncbi:MAG: DUF1972 domain-containing protein [Bacteroidota bacterium]
MKIAFIGSRGVPANYGGFETFVEETSVGLIEKYEHDIFVVGDSEQKQNFNSIDKYKGAVILYSRFNKTKNPLLYYLDSIRITLKKVDVIYCCGVGGALFFFIPWVFGTKYIVNHDGVNYKRDKWSFWKKKAIKFLFWINAKFSKYILNDSYEIQDLMKRDFGRSKNSTTIEYGAYLNDFSGKDKIAECQKFLEEYSLTYRGYHLVVARLEPENKVHTIIEGYLNSSKKYPLVVVGNLKDTQYVFSLKKLSEKSSNIRLIGGVYGGNKLSIMRASAIDYLHGHSVGGTNPSLLEAMASSNLCICHDNPFNRGVVKENGYYFKNEKGLGRILTNIEENIDSELNNRYRVGVKNRIVEYYNWPSIVKRYSEYFESL